MEACIHGRRACYPLRPGHGMRIIPAKTENVHPTLRRTVIRTSRPYELPNIPSAHRPAAALCNVQDLKDTCSATPLRPLFIARCPGLQWEPLHGNILYIPPPQICLRPFRHLMLPK